MGEASTGVEPTREPAEKLERDIADIREEITVLVDEVGRRRRDVFNIRKHALTIALLGGGVLAVATVGFMVARRRRRKRARLPARLAKLGKAVSRAIERPEPALRYEPGVLAKVVRALLTSLATKGARALVARMLYPVLPSPPSRTG